MCRLTEKLSGHQLKIQTNLFSNQGILKMKQQNALWSLSTNCSTYAYAEKTTNIYLRYVILHAATLTCLQPIAYHRYSSAQPVLGYQPNTSHLYVFNYVVQVLIASPEHTKWSTTTIRNLYWFDSPSINRYLEPLTWDVFTARFVDCHFIESIFPPLGERIRNRSND